MHSLLPDLAPLKASRDFRLVYGGQFVSAFGSALTYVVLPLQIYQLTRSTVLVGLLGVVEFVALLAMAFVSGLLADRFDRRRLLIATDAALMLCCVGLTVNALAAKPAVWPLWILAGLMAGLSAIHRPAMEALTPQLVETRHMPAVSALQGFRYSFAHIAGPALAGWLAVRYGMALAFALDALTYLFALAVITRIASRPVPGQEDTIRWSSFLEGWRYAWTRQDLIGTYLIDMNAMFFGMPNALFPALAERWGAETVGMLYAAPAVGSLIVTATSGWTIRIRRHGAAIVWAASLWGVAIIGFGMADALPWAIAFLMAAGAADTVSGIFRGTIWNQTIPARLRGRLAAIEMVSYLSGPYLGNAEAGLAARLFGLRTAVVSGGVLCVAGSVLLAALLPRFWRYRAPESGGGAV